MSVLSHELKSPLNAVEEFQHLILKRQAGDKIENYDPFVKRSIERIQSMRSLIMDLLDLTKIESGYKNRSLKDIDLVEIARQVIESNKTSAEKRNIKFNFFFLIR
ncbi:MAG: HAMP domain-containing histidine kinase [Chloroflexia bacterium]|nr:HAMP domain-containing histidine kinase [Chloroflexia bacterium]